MFSATLTDEQQRHLAKNVTNLLTFYKHISDSFIIVSNISTFLLFYFIVYSSATTNIVSLVLLQEFFSENLWESLPISWQESLSKLSPPEIADLLLDKTVTNRR